MKPFCLLLVLFLSCQRGTPDNSALMTNDEVFQYAHQFVRWFYNDQLDSLSQHINNKNFTLDDLKRFKVQAEDQLGKEEELLFDRNFIYVKDGKTNYENIRDCRFSRSARPVRILFGFDNQQTIYKFEVSILPREAHTTHINYQTKTKLKLPFEGEWYVASGGRTVLHNGHAISANQRFAYDFLIKKEGYTFRNEGKYNKDYFCFEKNVVAPGKGRVFKVINHIEENEVGKMGEGDGNTVVIDHGNGEYSVIAHFKKGSIVVEVGDEVNSGQFLGLCGNSGRSFQPHIHYHLQTMPENGPGEGLPLQFASYKLDSISHENSEPTWGQRIRNQ